MKIERDVFGESSLTDRNPQFQSAAPAPLLNRRYSLVRAIYIAVLAAATLGWLWLIAWIAVKLI
jgi:hypothetical protein